MPLHPRTRPTRLRLRPRLAALALVAGLLGASAGWTAAAAQSAAPDGRASYVAAAGGSGRFALASGGRAAPLHVDAGDHAGVIRAARDLQADVECVTGTRPALAVGGPPAGREVVLVGTLGRSPLIDRLVRERKLDVSGDRGAVGDLPPPDRDGPAAGRGARAGDRRQRQARHHLRHLRPVARDRRLALALVGRRAGRAASAELYVLPGRHTRGEPAVKYRGIFINDEAPGALAAGPARSSAASTAASTRRCSSWCCG